MMPEDLERMPWLEPPKEIFEFQAGVPATFYATDFKIGRMTIQPKWPGAPPEKVVATVRLFIPERFKPTFPHYWDITPSRLVTQLSALLVGGTWRGFGIEILRDIPGPKAHFAIRLVAIPP